MLGFNNTLFALIIEISKLVIPILLSHYYEKPAYPFSNTIVIYFLFQRVGLWENSSEGNN